jgi:hypothetical protein
MIGEPILYILVLMLIVSLVEFNLGAGSMRAKRYKLVFKLGVFKNPFYTC